MGEGNAVGPYGTDPLARSRLVGSGRKNGL